jgi:hypothetical protein
VRPHTTPARGVGGSPQGGGVRKSQVAFGVGVLAMSGNPGSREIGLQKLKFTIGVGVGRFDHQ